MDLIDAQPTGFSRFEIFTCSFVTLLCLALVSVFLEAEGIEADVHARAHAAVRQAALQWSAVEVDGQHIIVKGVSDRVDFKDILLRRLNTDPAIAGADVQLEIVPDHGLCQSRLDVFLKQADIRFKPGSDALEPESLAGVERMAAVIRHCAPRIEVAAHAARRGDDEINQQLTERRAAEVARQLVRAGVTPSQLIVAGLGESQPIHLLTSEVDDRKNERVTFRVRGRPA
jgi:outer membrane protein OmpA-like peptidoglycan-associated protein